MTSAQTLRQLFAESGGFVVPGVQNALTAKIAEEIGFRAVLFTGAGFANIELGVPDMGLTTMTEVVQEVQRIVDAVDIPVIADADTGYGNALNVRRTVRELERADIATHCLRVHFIFCLSFQLSASFASSAPLRWVYSLRFSSARLRPRDGASSERPWPSQSE